MEKTEGCPLQINIDIKGEKMKKRYGSYVVLFIVFLFFALTCCADIEAQSSIPLRKNHDKNTSKGYLQSNAMHNISKFLPPPPKKGTARFALDEKISKDTLKLRNTPRWELATKDADLSELNIARIFECVIDLPINENDTPILYTLIKRILIDAGRLSDSAKSLYKRERPFLVNNEPVCTPSYEKQLRMSSSYPSGHTIVGWTLALVLSEIVPEKADMILARGRVLGESRIVCNVHWLSDVVEGYMLGAALTAKLHGEPAFRADLDAVRAEIISVSGKKPKPLTDCKVDTGLLKY